MSMHPEQAALTTRLVVIDMQRVFAEETAWHVPSLQAIVPEVRRLVEAFGPWAWFARFVAPRSEAIPTGCWKDYYRRWSMMTEDAVAPGLFGLMAPFSALAEPDRTFDKQTYSIFGSKALVRRLQEENVERLVFAGVETDVCVYASVLDAVDAGFHVVLAADGLASGSDAAHAAVMQCLAPRLQEQIEIASTQQIVSMISPPTFERTKP